MDYHKFSLSNQKEENISVERIKHIWLLTWTSINLSMCNVLRLLVLTQYNQSNDSAFIYCT